jgi:hypothetical protein
MDGLGGACNFFVRGPKGLWGLADNQINDGLSLTVEAGPALRPMAGVHNLC